MGRPGLESDRKPRSARLRQALEPVLAAIVPPLTAYALESVLWRAIPGLLLFNAAVIASSWIGGLKSGIVSTIISSILAWYLMQQGGPGGVNELKLYAAAGMFLAVGIAISVFHARLKRASRELKRTTQELNESKSLLQAVFDHSPNAIVVKNLEGKFLLTNRHFQETFGLTGDALHGMTDYDVLPPADADRHRAIDQEAIDGGGPVTAEETGRLRDAVLTFLETVFPLRDGSGNTFGVCWIGTEISDIKRAEKALAHTAADLKEAQRVAHIGSWIWHVGSEEAEWSEELFRIYGLDPSKPAPTYHGDFQKLLTPEGATALNEAIAKLEKRGEPYELDLEILRPDGGHRWVSVRGEPIKDKSGKLVAIRGTSQDVTQLKQLQRLKEEWMSVIAHDLRQPIGVIKMSASLLPELHHGAFSEEEGAVTERIRSAVKGLARMVDDLLDMSRIEARHLSLDRSWVDPCALVRRTVAGLSHLTTDYRVNVTEERDVPRVFVDLVRFEQILGNLISNAVKHGEKGGEINVAVAHDGFDVRISVSNRGKGIAPEDVPRLFSRFGRSSTTQEPAAPGLGLGLYIAKGLVEAHGGRIWVDSVPGRETTFHFTLPGRVPAKEAA